MTEEIILSQCTDTFLPQALQSILGTTMAGEHDPRISSSLAILDVNCHLVSLPGLQAVGTIDLNVSVIVRAAFGRTNH